MSETEAIDLGVAKASITINDSELYNIDDVGADTFRDISATLEISLPSSPEEFLGPKNGGPQGVELIRDKNFAAVALQRREKPMEAEIVSD